MEITKEQFEAYVSVQETGMFNMFDPRAREAAGLGKAEYMSIIKNYDKLEDKYANNNE